MKPITKNEIVNALHSVDLTKGHTVMVHTALSKMGYVCGGAQTVIEALIEVVGEDGTIMMPTQSWKNLDPEDGVHWTVPEEYWQIIRDNWPAYDKRITPTNTMDPLRHGANTQNISLMIMTFPIFSERVLQ